jgi:formate dehydrogenase subunit gamma
MGYRIAGAVTAFIAALLLLWVVVATFLGDDLVEPTVRVTAGQQPGETGVLAGEVLADRTRLQRWRGEVGPSPEGETPPQAYASEYFAMEPGVPTPRELVRSWQGNVADVAEMLRPSERVEGHSSVPYQVAQFFEDPSSRVYRERRNDIVRHAGGWLIFGAIFVLAAFLAVRGRVEVKDGFSGETVPRFNWLERGNHWMVATAFVVLGLTGLVIIYGRTLLIPLIGPQANGDVAWASAWLHMAFAVPFTLGLLAMIVLWVRENIPNRLDWVWLKRGAGGMVDPRQEPPPTPKMNAGQKLIFWAVVLLGLLLVATGVGLMFPFYWTGLVGMQWTQLIHAGLGLLMIALIIGHIYIGTIGMEGAFQAMWNGRVDRNWAREHHSIWYKRLMGASEHEIEREKARAFEPEQPHGRDAAGPAQPAE